MSEPVVVDGVRLGAPVHYVRNLDQPGATMACCGKPWSSLAPGEGFTSAPTGVTCPGVSYADADAIAATPRPVVADPPDIEYVGPHGEEPPHGLVQVVRHSRRQATYAELDAVLRTLPVMSREARRARAWTTKEFGQRVGLSSSTVSRLENGKPVTLDTASAVLRWLATTTASKT